MRRLTVETDSLALHDAEQDTQRRRLRQFLEELGDDSLRPDSDDGAKMSPASRAKMAPYAGADALASIILDKLRENPANAREREIAAKLAELTHEFGEGDPDAGTFALSHWLASGLLATLVEPDNRLLEIYNHHPRESGPSPSIFVDPSEATAYFENERREQFVLWWHPEHGATLYAGRGSWTTFYNVERVDRVWRATGPTGELALRDREQRWLDLCMETFEGSRLEDPIRAWGK